MNSGLFDSRAETLNQAVKWPRLTTGSRAEKYNVSRMHSLKCSRNHNEKGKKKLAVWEKVFSKFEEDEIRKINLSCQKIDGAEKSDIKLEDLDEDTQMNIEAGLISLQDAIRDAGGQMYGDRIQEIRPSVPDPSLA